VFVDIDPRTCTLDPSRIEAAITPRSTAIMPVHCYGNRCDVEGIGAIARRHGLRVIYDAAHVFGVGDDAGSLLRHGDLSVLSFHATKVFSTIEGGAIVCRDAAMLERVKRLRNFGLVDEETVTEVGINGKMNEVCAAFGLLQLGHVAEVLARLRRLDRRYRSALQDVEGIRCPELCGQEQTHHGFFPILVEPAYPLTRDALYSALRDAGIHARRYFYPLVTTFPMYGDHPSAARANLPVAHAIAEQVICLPIFAAMTDAQQARVVEVIWSARRHAARRP
jgi:dTDP-4-amino-4,6-dideoxygalactose transaminase